MAQRRKHRAILGASTNATILKTGGGNLRSVSVFSLDATPVFLKFYDKATTPDENDVPVYSVEAPAAATPANGSRTSETLEGAGIPFSAGLSYRCVTSLADNGTGALSANEVIVNLTYD